MPNKFDYTSQARKIALKFPVFNHVSIQVNFWILAFLLLSFITHTTALSISSSYSLQLPTSYIPSILISIIIGIIYGTSLGFVDILLGKGYIQRWPMGVIILLRGVIYYIVLIAMMLFIRYIVWQLLIVPYFFDGSSPFRTDLTWDLTWKYFFYILLVYTAISTAIISFINQMNKKFGPGVLLPMLLGKYRNPIEEKRIFMFMDLKSSTTHAEKLGHIKYSALIRDSFMDINQVLARHNAEIYQYVGDEIVVSWPISEGLRGMACVEFFFSTQDQFNQRLDYYIENYGFVPQFKAGLHLGLVTAVEIGEIKREIAYHGDTLNTAARIQSICNQYNKSFLISQDVKTITDLDNIYNLESLGQITLKGKDIPIEVFSIDSKKNNV
jgi:adenylate cyclase